MTAAPRPWIAAGADQQRLAVGERAAQRGERRRGRRRRGRRCAGAEQVAGAAAEHQEAGEGEGVGVDDPLQAGLGEAERVVDRGQRDVDDRDVEDHHQLRRCCRR